MATQTLEFYADTGLTITSAKLFVDGSDTVQANSSTVVERTNAKGLYSAQYTDLPAGTYILHAFDAAGLVAISNPIVTLAATGTYRAKTLETLTVEVDTTAIADAVVAEIGTAGITISLQSPNLTAGGKLTLFPGDDYDDDTTPATTINATVTGTGIGDRTSDAWQLWLNTTGVAPVSEAGVASRVDANTLSLVFSVPRAKTSTLANPAHGFWAVQQIEASSGDISTRIKGPLVVERNPRTQY